LQNALTLWNTAERTDWTGESPARRNPQKRKTAPAPSIANVRPRVRIKSRTMPERESTPTPPASRRRCLSPILSRISSERAVVAAITPRPPSWINSSRTAWEDPVRSLPVSTTERPVTQTAEVAVNSASTALKGRPRALRRKSNRVPVTISPRNPMTIFLSIGREV